MSTYQIDFPKNFMQYYMYINLYAIFNSEKTRGNTLIDVNNITHGKTIHKNVSTDANYLKQQKLKNKLILYNPKANEKNTDTIFCKSFTDYDIFDTKTLKNYIANAPNPFFKNIPIEQLFQDLIIAKKRYINPSVVFSKEFNSQLLLSRHTIRRHLKKTEYILIQIDETSIKNIIYYILAIHSILKVEKCKTRFVEEEANDTLQIISELPEESDDKVTLTNEISIAVYCDYKSNFKENRIECEKFMNDLCSAMPALRPRISNACDLVEEHYKKYKTEILRVLLLGSAYYVIVSNTQDLLFSVAISCNTHLKIAYPKRIIPQKISNQVNTNLIAIDANTAKTNKDVTGRVIPI